MKKLLLTLSLSLAVLPVYADEMSSPPAAGQDLPPPRTTPLKPSAVPAAPAQATPAVVTPHASTPEPRVMPAAPASAPMVASTPAASEGFAGFYVGASAGYLFSNTDVLLDIVGPATLYDVKGMGGEGPSFGLYAGWGTMLGQSGKVYGGIEAGYQFNNSIDSSAYVSLPTYIRLEEQDSWNISGRLGYLFTQDTMVYGRLGYVRTKFSFNHSTTPSALGPTYKDHANGVILGLGVEHHLNKQWSLRGEYDYLNHESMDFNKLNGAATSASMENNSSLFSVGLSYTF